MATGSLSTHCQTCTFEEGLMTKKHAIWAMAEVLKHVLGGVCIPVYNIYIYMIFQTCTFEEGLVTKKHAIWAMGRGFKTCVGGRMYTCL